MTSALKSFRAKHPTYARDKMREYRYDKNRAKRSVVILGVRVTPNYLRKVDRGR